MSDSFGISISGLGGVLARIEGEERRIRTAAQMSIYDTTKKTFDLSQERCPVLSGDLKDSGKMEVNDLDGRVSYGGEMAPYALPVALGHHTRSGSWVAPQDWITPAFDEASAEFPGMVKGKLGV